MKTRITAPFRKVMDKLRSIEADPSRICYGYAFGIFMSTTPLIGLKWLVALPVIFLVKWNKTACLIGILHINYITGPFFYSLAFLVGKGVCGFPATGSLPSKLDLNWIREAFFGNAEIFLALFTGGLILGIPLTIGAYYLAKSLFSNHIQRQFT